MELASSLVQNENAPRVLAAAAVVAVVPAYAAARRAFRAWAMRTFTAVPDVARAGVPRRGGRIKGTAVICGGSLAGLFAARVCADHFERVIVIEPEGWTFTDAAREPPVDDVQEVIKEGDETGYKAIRPKRTRIYQYIASHGYQALLTQVLQALFPNSLEDALKKFGIPLNPADPNAVVAGHWFAVPWNAYPGGEPPLVPCSSRRALEPFIRGLVKDACPETEYIHGTVTDLVVEGRRVSGVVVRSADGTSRTIECALVADCTGVAQVGLKMLSRALGSSLPDSLREHYGLKMQYSTLEFPRVGLTALLEKVKPQRSDGLGPLVPEKGSLIFSYNPDPRQDPRTALFLRTENDGVALSGGGWDCELPQNLTELREFLERTKDRAMIPPSVFALIDELEPYADQALLGEVHINVCSRIHYARAAGVLPTNFVALGDSNMRMNPRFGEGTSKVAIGAMTLDGVLRDVNLKSASFARTFFKRLDARTGTIWDAAKYADYGHPTTTPAAGESAKDGAFALWLNGKIQPLLSTNAVVAKTLWDMSNFLAPPIDLFSPYILFCILRQTIWPTRA